MTWRNTIQTGGWTVTEHPARWTPAILDTLAPILLELGLPVHDPFAGTGERLGELCTRLGLTFTGTEIEPEFIVERRVDPGDSTMPLTYPGGPHVVVTSPVYPNGMADHFHARDASRRHTYRQALASNLGGDRPLHPNNMGRWGNRYRRSQRSENEHFRIAAACIKHWPDHAIVNVKDVVATTYRVDVIGRWRELLTAAGYEITRVIEVATPGQRNGANGHLRAEHEAVIVAQRTGADHVG